MSGKDTMVFVVRRGDETLCAKTDKEATNRSFRQAVAYTETARPRARVKPPRWPNPRGLVGRLKRQPVKR